MTNALLIPLELLAILILVLLNGFFVAAEFALVKIRDTQLRGLIVKGDRRAKMAQKVIGNLGATLSACQVGITMASLGLGWIGEPVFSALLGPVMSGLGIESEQTRHSISFLVGFTAITFLHIVAGEQAPKWFAIQKPLNTALWVAVPLDLFHRISYPFIWVLNYSSLWLLRRLGIEPVGEGDMHVSEDELRLLITTSQKRIGPAHGKDILLNLRQRIVRDVMHHRQEIVGFDTDDSLDACLEIAEKTRYSRFPLFDKGDPDKALGVVHIKDLFAMRSKAQKGADLIGVARKMIYIPAMIQLESLLRIFLEKRLHLAFVVDEYGGTVGIVTLEDIVEELVGPIQDEFDQEKAPVEKINDREWMLAGSLPLQEFLELTGESLTAESVNTVGGWITEKLGEFPKVGDVLSAGHFQLKVMEMDGHRVSRIQLQRIGKTDDGQGGMT